MRKNIHLLLILFALTACGGGDDGGGETPEINKDFLSAPPSLELLADGQTTEITISSNCNWTITKDADWLTVTPTSGSNTQKITISAMKNTTEEDRMAVLSVKGGSLPARTITITQLKVVENLSLSVNKTTLDYERNGGTQTFIITSNTSWTISCPDWCTLSISSGKGNATISVTASDNPTTEQRSGQLVISGDGVSTSIIDVTQQPGEEISHEPGADDNELPS